MQTPGRAPSPPAPGRAASRVTSPPPTPGGMSGLPPRRAARCAAPRCTRRLPTRSTLRPPSSRPAAALPPRTRDSGAGGKASVLSHRLWHPTPAPGPRGCGARRVRDRRGRWKEGAAPRDSREHVGAVEGKVSVDPWTQIRYSLRTRRGGKARTPSEF